MVAVANRRWRGMGTPVEGAHAGSSFPYRRVRCIGSGASSEVFEAIDPLGRVVALKVLRHGLAASRGAVHRFAQEARALALIEHPNVVAVLDTGICPDGRPYSAMPLLTGETLRERLQRARTL